MHKRSTDSEESCAPMNRRMFPKFITGALIFTILLGAISWLGAEGIRDMKQDIASKVDKSQYDSDMKFLKNTLTDIKSDIKDTNKMLREHEQYTRGRK